jgi:hypothetical protein
MPFDPGWLRMNLLEANIIMFRRLPFLRFKITGHVGGGRRSAGDSYERTSISN